MADPLHCSTTPIPANIEIPKHLSATRTLPSKRTAGSKSIFSSPTPASKRTARGRSLTFPGTLSNASVLVESISLSMCRKILLGRFPLERMSSKSASLVKWKRGNSLFFPLHEPGDRWTSWDEVSFQVRMHALSQSLRSFSTCQ